MKKLLIDVLFFVIVAYIAMFVLSFLPINEFTQGFWCALITVNVYRYYRE